MDMTGLVKTFNDACDAVNEIIYPPFVSKEAHESGLTAMQQLAEISDKRDAADAEKQVAAEYLLTHLRQCGVTDLTIARLSDYLF